RSHKILHVADNPNTTLPVFTVPHPVLPVLSVPRQIALSVGKGHALLYRQSERSERGLRSGEGVTEGRWRTSAMGAGATVGVLGPQFQGRPTGVPRAEYDGGVVISQGWEPSSVQATSQKLAEKPFPLVTKGGIGEIDRLSSREIPSHFTPLSFREGELRSAWTTSPTASADVTRSRKILLEHFAD